MNVFSFAILMSAVQWVECANILILHPLDLKSHLAYLEPLAEALAEKNHSVTIVTNDKPGFDGGKFEVIRTSDIEYAKLTWESVKGSFMSDLLRAHDFTQFNLRAFLNSHQMKDLFASNRTFDAVISNTFLFFQSLAIVPHHFNALAIEFMPQGNHLFSLEYSGVFINSMQEYNPHKNFLWNNWQRSKKTWQITISLLFNKFVVIPKQQEIIDETYGPAMGRLNSLLYEKSLILANGHSSLSTPKYVPFLQKDVAGISIRPRVSLPKEYDAFISQSTSGFVLVSWGTLLSSWDGQTGDTVLEALRLIPHQVIWKASRTNFTRDLPKNVMISSWVPQASLLGDKRIKAFWTHGGFSSMVETVHYGVPVIVTPSSLDQPLNAAHMTGNGMGLELQLNNFSIASLTWTIGEVLNNPKYKIAASRASEEFQSRLVSPRDEAVFWIERAIKYRTRLSMDFNYVLSIFVISNLDIFAGSLSIVLIILLVSRRLFGLVFRRNLSVLTKSKPKLL